VSDCFIVCLTVFREVGKIDIVGVEKRKISGWVKASEEGD
jgi:hypothetical protein